MVRITSEIAFTENMFNVTDAAAAIRDYAESGYNLVIAHGAQYSISLFEIAPISRDQFCLGHDNQHRRRRRCHQCVRL